MTGIHEVEVVIFVDPCRGIRSYDILGSLIQALEAVVGYQLTVSPGVKRYGSLKH